MITGNTRLLAHIGYPTRTFRSPMIYNPWFAHVGEDVVVVPFASQPDRYPALLRALFDTGNVVGALITMPHKSTTPALLDRVSVGACNAVRRAPDGSLEGDMFDGEGFVLGMQRNGFSARGCSALVVGSGGVGSAIAASLAAAGVARLALFDVREPVMQALAGRLRQHYPTLEVVSGSTDPAGFDIVVNATPLGMKAGDPLPLDVMRISPRTYVGEVVLSAEVTPFLAAAQARGCQGQGGLDMLYEQIPTYLAYFGLPVATPEKLRALADPMA